MKLTIIIPVFNEKLLKLLALVEKQKFIDKQIIIVDDCSNDNSFELINEFKFLSEYKILKHQNYGKGECIKTAKVHKW